jgi:putative transposase
MSNSTIRGADGKPKSRYKPTTAGGKNTAGSSQRLNELVRENSKLKRLVAELSLEKQVLKDVADGNF